MAVTESPSRYRWQALGLAFLSQWCASIVSLMLAPLAPLFQSDLNLSKAQVGLFTSAVALGGWIVALPGGLITDRLDIRRVVSGSLVIAGALLLAMWGANDILWAVAIMFAAGFFRGGAFPGSTKAVLNWFPARTRATAMGVKQVGNPVAGIMAALTLPALGLALGWRAAISVVGALVLLGGLVIGFLYRDPPGLARTSGSAVNFRAALRETLRNRTVWALSSIAFAFVLVQLALNAYLALYFKEVVLVSTVPDEAARIVAAGGYLAVCQAGGVVGRIFWGVVSDRVFRGRRAVVLAIIGGLAALMSLVMAQSGAGYPLWLLAAMVFAYGATAVGWNGVYNARLTETVGRKYAATGLGLSITLSEGATVMGPPLFGLIVDTAGSYQPAWLFLGCVSVAGTVAALLASRAEKPPGRR